MNTLMEFSEIPGWLWAVLVVLAVFQIAVQIFALIVLFRTPEERVLTGKRWIWLLVILLGSLVGSIVFLFAGRKPLQAADPLAQGVPPASTADRATRAADVLYGPQEDRAAESQGRAAGPR